MTDIPSWVVVSAGIFFLVQILSALCTIFLIFKVVQTMQELAPKVEAISVKVKEIGDKVEDLTDSVKSTADTVGARAKSISGSADSIAQTAATSFERYSPYVVGILSALRILRAVQEFRAGTQRAGAKGHVETRKRVAKPLAKVDNRDPK